MSATIRDFTDRELLHLLLDYTNGSGGLTTFELVERLHLSGENTLSQAGSRLGWLKRYGMVDRSEGRWYVTADAEQMVRARLNAAKERALATLTDREALTALTFLTPTYMGMSETRGHLLRREWAYWTEQRKRRRR